MMENKFERLVTDVNERDRQPDSYEDMLNARSWHHKGEGLVVATLMGMEVSFQLPSGYAPIGGAEYSGVLYMVSLNATTDMVEFGSYPSPDYDECTGWKKEYQAFHNYTASVNYNHPDFLAACGQGLSGVPREDLRFSNEYAGWSCERRLDVFGRESFDGTVNLYLCDGESPNLVINSGFHYLTGACVSRFVSLADLQNGNLVQFNESATQPRIQLNKVGNNGKLSAGNYFYFVRYSNQNRATTSFVLPSHPVTIPGSPQSGADGDPDTYGGRKDFETNHSVTLDITGLDPSYQTFELGYVYFADGFNEAYVIEQVYYISAETVKQVTVTGYEAVSSIEVEEFLALKPFEKACRSHTEVNNQYYGANWKGRVLHHPDLCAFAKAVVIGEQRKLMGDHDIDLLNLPNNGDYNAYADETDVFRDVGYFSSEAYCFVAVPLFNNGSIGLGYPMTGTDNLTGTPVGSNEKGIYRVSSASASAFVEETGELYAKKVTFDFSAAVATTWISENVKSWIVCRAERRPNLLYQGIAIPAYDGQVIASNHYYWTDFKVEDISWTTQRWAPLVEGVDFFFLRDGTGSERREIRYGWSDPVGQGESMRQPQSRKEGYYGIFSPDYMADNHKGRKLPSGGVVMRIGSHASPDRLAVNGDSKPVFKDGNFNQMGWYYDAWDFTADQTAGEVSLFDVNAFDYSPNNGFVSRFDNGSEPIGNGWYWIEESEAGTNDILLNMPMAMPAYIGVSKWDDDAEDIENHLVNVYLTDPNDLTITDLYDPVNEFFYPISDPLPNNYTGTAVLGGGDCFVQRTFLKTIHGTNNFDEDLLGFIAESGNLTKNIEKGYGTMISYVAEHRHNTALRVQRDGNLFFPATGMEDGGSFVFRYNQPETPFVNDGYQRTLPPRALRGFDPVQFYGDEHYKTRIRHTNPQLIAGQTDSYRNSGVQQMKDFDLQFGPIVRIMEDLNRLYSFQERAINLHPINERATSETSEGNKVITGQVLGLTDYVDRLSDHYGSQHTFAIVKGMRGIHGIDADRRLWWRVEGNSVRILSIEKGCDRLVRETIEAVDPDSNVCARLADNPLCGSGIHGAYDRVNKEVLFTFRFEGESALNRTIVFSETKDEFSHRTNFFPTIYFNINDELYSYDLNGTPANRVWLHDASETRNSFYGQTKLGLVKFTVNTEARLEKMFHQQLYNSRPEAFFYITWETEDQSTDLVISTAPFWLAPEYRNRAWKQPIPDAKTITLATNSASEVGSHMTGRWLVTTIHFDLRTPLLLRDVQTLATEAKH